MNKNNNLRSTTILLKILSHFLSRNCTVEKSIEPNAVSVYNLNEEELNKKINKDLAGEIIS